MWGIGRGDIPGSVVPLAKMTMIGAHFPSSSSLRVIITFELGGLLGSGFRISPKAVISSVAATAGALATAGASTGADKAAAVLLRWCSSWICLNLFSRAMAGERVAAEARAGSRTQRRLMASMVTMEVEISDLESWLQVLMAVPCEGIYVPLAFYRQSLGIC